MFGLFKLESGFREKSFSKLSSARGFGAFLKSSGEFVYEELLKYGEYNHDMAFDGYINMEMTAELLDYNMKKYDGDIMKSLIAYNGNELGPRYYDIIDTFLNTETNKTLAKMEDEYKIGLSTNGG